MVSPDLLAAKVLTSADKFECRFHLESSEDSVSWSILRSFYEARCLHLLARLITGREVTEEPVLFLWGLVQTDDRMTLWPLLRAARERFEVGRIPAGRPYSEPDAMVLVDGQFLAIIECKVKSPNSVILPGPRTNEQSLTLDETIAIYSDATNRMLDLERAAKAPRLMGQLLRYAILGQYQASLCSPRTDFFLCNLTRAGECNDTFEEFHRIVRPEFKHRVTHLHWEHLYPLAGLAGRRLAPLRKYMLTKTVNLRPMFRLSYF